VSSSRSPVHPLETACSVARGHGYTAPEKLKGGSTDHRSDVFSLGVDVEALTHARLFIGATEAG
jgi:serine/threonine protein kinase